MGGYLDKLLQYIETPAARNKIVKRLSNFVMVGGAILTVLLLAATFLR